MATPKNATGPAPASCRLEVKVIPGASRDEVAGTMGDAVKIKLRAPPVEGRANEALIEFLAARLDLPRRALSLVRGDTSRQKLLRVDGLDLSAVRARLGF
ncbi:MAG TPA: DUF167 domain-containing protein [Opitutaceae bacterium]|nr:DUF167 domain-containing protein [Opitutaceae bacterium]